MHEMLLMWLLQVLGKGAGIPDKSLVTVKEDHLDSKTDETLFLHRILLLRRMGFLTDKEREDKKNGD